MRQRPAEDDGSLDSLLDTMTNVVGILVIVLVVTQLGVKQAVKRIGEMVDPKIVAATEEELERANSRREELLSLVENVSAPTVEDPAAELRRLEQQIAEARKKLESSEQEALARSEQLEEQTKSIEELNEREKEIREKLEAALARKAEVEALLEETPPRDPEGDALEAKVVNLPNPRPAPKDAGPAMVHCRDEKLYLLNLEDIRKTAQAQAEQIIVSRRLDRDPEQGIDPEKFIAAFNANKIVTDYFRVGMTARGRQPWLVFERREDRGHPLSILRRRSSRYQEALQTLDPEKFYIQFLVWPDSFEIYLEARNIAAEHGLLAGWNPETSTDEYQVPLGGPLALGPPPAPQPTPPTPTPPNPNPQPERPKPVDTID